MTNTPLAEIRRLSPRQLEVLRLMAEGQTDRKIGETLGISESTVNAHAMAVLNKIGAANRTHACVIAVRSGAI